MFPNEATYNREMRDTADEISQGKPLLIGKNIWLNDPVENKLLSWVLASGNRVPVDNHVFGDLEDAPFPNWVVHSGVTETAQLVTALPITGVHLRCAIGTRLYVPRTGEIIRLNADPTTDATAGVTRNFGRGDATSLLRKNERLLLIGPRFEEGFTSGKGITNALTYKTYATGILDYPLKITGTETAEKSRAGPPFERALFKSWKQTKDHMTGSLLFSGEKLDTSTYTYNMHTETGLGDFIETNIFAINGSINRMDFFDILLEWKLNNEKGGLLTMSLQMYSLISQWVDEKVTYRPGDNELGLVIEKIKTIVGDFDITTEHLLSQDPYLAGQIYGIPEGLIDYAPMVGNGRDRDIRYLPFDREEVDAEEGTIRGEYGWWPHMEEKFLFVSGIEF